MKYMYVYSVFNRFELIIQTYLTDRQQRVQLNKQCYSKADVTSGVPQGRVRALALFCSLVNSDQYHSFMQQY